MARRKRAAGGGRRPQGEFQNLTSPFSLRMPPDLRKQVEVAARRNRRSTSQEMLRRLQDSFRRDQTTESDRPLRALCYLIAQVADYSSHQEPRSWRSDPFKFKTFKRGVSVLLDKLDPPGEVVGLLDRARGEGNPIFNSYEQYGDFIGEGIWSELQRASTSDAEVFADNIVEYISDFNLPKAQAKIMRDILPAVRQRMKDHYVSLAYNMIRAKSDLQLVPRQEHREGAKKEQ